MDVWSDTQTHEVPIVTVIKQEPQDDVETSEFNFDYTRFVINQEPMEYHQSDPTEIQFKCIFCQKIFNKYIQLKQHVKKHHRNICKEYDDETKPCYVLLNNIERRNDGFNWVRLNEGSMQKIDLNRKYCILRADNRANYECNPMEIDVTANAEQLDDMFEEYEGMLPIPEVCLKTENIDGSYLTNVPASFEASFDAVTKNKYKKYKRVIVHREFKKEWTANYAFVSNEDNFPMCLICKEKLAHNKKSNLERHFLKKHAMFANMYPIGEARKKAVEELQKKTGAVVENVVDVVYEPVQTTNNVNLASFIVSQEIARRGRPFTDGEYIKCCFLNTSEELFKDFANRTEILRRIAELPLSSKTVKSRTVKMSSDVTQQLVEEAKLTPFMSIAVDEFCDSKDVAQISLYIRYLTPTGPKEELLGFFSLKGPTHGEDVANAVLECMEKHQLPLNKIVSIATNGANSMAGPTNRFISVLKQKINPDALTFHCFVYQEALCAQIFPEDIVRVMELIIKATNNIIVKGLNQHQFVSFLNEVKNEYQEHVLSNKVRWLSRGQGLKYFASCLGEIRRFLNMKSVRFPELIDDQWLQKMSFLVDITEQLNYLNVKLQAKGNTTYSMLEELTIFQNKMLVLFEDLNEGSLLHFKELYGHRQRNNTTINTPYFKNVILNMTKSFMQRYEELTTNKLTLQFILFPLWVQIDTLNLSLFDVDLRLFEMQLIDLKSKETWSSKFVDLRNQLENLDRERCNLIASNMWSIVNDLEQEDTLVFNAWNSLPDCYGQLKKFAFGILTIFGSTYSCEQSFLHLNHMRSTFRCKINDENLESCLKMKTTSYTPNIRKLSSDMQAQCSR